MKTSTIRNLSRHLPPLAAVLFLLSTVLSPATAAAGGQKSFASAEEGASALADACRSGNSGEVRAILGPGSAPIVSSGDPVADRAALEGFARRHDEKRRIDVTGGDRATLVLGNEERPFAVPLVRKGGRWRFDAAAGKEEIVNRRIGRNELEAIDVMHAYVDAQREYASRDRNGDGVKEFAPKFRSSAGKKDGLYWEAKEGEDRSPFGPMVARADGEGYGRSRGGDREPYHGYRFRILKGQGASVEGGAFDYLANGRMILGFALVAYPAQYGQSGIMTFLVNQNGVVYQKDLGKDTGRIGAAMKRYDPGKGWKKADQDQ